MKKTTTKNAATSKISEVKQSKQETKKSQQQVVKSNSVPKKTEKIIYLVEGVKGKELINNKIETNNSHKKEVKSISWCIRQALQHDKEYFTKFKNFNPKDITPFNLLKFKKPTEAIHGNFSVWLVLTLASRYYKGTK